MSEVSQASDRATFWDWTGNRELVSLGTNAGAPTLPFQNWRKLKEAFAPELIARAINESPIPVQRCIDPFGGSGTTGLACQFLGVHPTLAEVNPYLADLIEAKLTPYASIETLNFDLNTVIEASNRAVPNSPRNFTTSFPRTFIEPGFKGRWIFDSQVAERIIAIRDAIEDLGGISRRLFRVLLGGILVEISNVRVSGKGRRYRRNWKNRVVPPKRVEELFSASCRCAIEDIRRFARRSVTSYDVIRGDSRTILQDIEQCDLAVFSPPYPNSFDYTDVYNLELWALGYLDSPQTNSSLRLATLSSHVQISRDFPEPPEGSPTLEEVLIRLDSRQLGLWDRRIPAMVGAYFSDLMEMLDHLSQILITGGSAWIVVGDSRYAGIQIPVARILGELVDNRGWKVLATESIRSMRTSAQQGGTRILSEQLLVLSNNS